jgi:alkylation response protein AidB-like acyl-CoA dehydrogenase
VYNLDHISIIRLPTVDHAIASKVFYRETSFRVASQAVQISGGYGLSEEDAAEKIFWEQGLPRLKMG